MIRDWQKYAVSASTVLEINVQHAAFRYITNRNEGHCIELPIILLRTQSAAECLMLLGDVCARHVSSMPASAAEGRFVCTSGLIVSLRSSINFPLWPTIYHEMVTRAAT